MNSLYRCPICYYPKLQFPPADYNICPSCGTEFGYDDFSKSAEELREEWIRGGAKWFSDTTRPPEGWNPYIQLNYYPSNINLETNAGTTSTTLEIGKFFPGVDIEQHA
jgi:hypothetical protein